MSLNSTFNTQYSKFILVIIVLLLGTGASFYLSSPETTLSRKRLSEFPKVLGDWTMVSDQQIDERSMRVLQVDDYFVRNYRNSRGEIIGLYIGYWKLQREGKGIHSPRQCLPGVGWVPVDTSVCELRVSTLSSSDSTFKIKNSQLSSSSDSTLNIQNSKSNSTTVFVNKYVMGKGLDRQLYLFWYQGRKRIYASEYWNRIYLIWDAVTRRRTDGALIRVNSVVRDSPDESLKAQTGFIELFVPVLKEYIPD